MILSSLTVWTDLSNFQLKIAKRWYDRGNKIEDLFAKFIFYFNGFNALYFLWKRINNISQGEGIQIENLLRKFDKDKSEIILGEIMKSIHFFTERRPISRMVERDSRTSNIGSLREGRKWQRLLTETNEPLEQIVAMGQILYLIRCNLVHGSKADAGDDEAIIDASIQPLKIFLEESIKITEHFLRKK